MKIKDEIKEIGGHWDKNPNETKDINEDILLNIEGFDWRNTSSLDCMVTWGEVLPSMPKREIIGNYNWNKYYIVIDVKPY